MPRWEPNAAGRLQDSALALFAEQGYEQTTVAQIAERAGVTERTFFNHFANKRDVLFGRTSERQRDVAARAITEASAETPLLEAMVRGLQAAAEQVLEDFRVPSRARRQIIDATAELAEREQAKHAALADALARALVERGASDDDARLTAGLGLLMQQAAEREWTRPDETRPLQELLARARDTLSAIASGRSR